MLRTHLAEEVEYVRRQCIRNGLAQNPFKAMRETLTSHRWYRLIQKVKLTRNKENGQPPDVLDASVKNVKCISPVYLSEEGGVRHECMS